MKFSFALAAVLASLVAAQSSGTASAPIPTPSASACIMTCSIQAVQSAGCSGITDISCVCAADNNFENAVRVCLTQQCPEQIPEALQLQQAICAGSGSASVTPTRTATSSAVNTSNTATVPSISSSASASASSAASSSRASSIVASASSILNSLSSAAASATGSPNAATNLPVFKFAAVGIWTAVAFGGVAIAQLAL